MVPTLVCVWRVCAILIGRRRLGCGQFVVFLLPFWGLFFPSFFTTSPPTWVGELGELASGEQDKPSTGNVGASIHQQ